MAERKKFLMSLIKLIYKECELCILRIVKNSMLTRDAFVKRSKCISVSEQICISRNCSLEWLNAM